MPARRALVAVAALAAAGFAVAAVLVREHAQAHAGMASFCAINEFVNCDRVATSRWSVALGLPVAVWGALAYGAVLILAVSGLRARRPHQAWPAGLLFVLGAAATAVAIGLALVSELVIGALCLLCAASWLLSGAILLAAWRATKPGGVGASLRSDAAALRSRPVLTAGVVLACAALVALTAAAYPRYWERPRRDRASAPPASAPPAAATVSGHTVIVEFSDYACPFCARAHEDAKAMLARRPDLTVVQRNFPLDPSCNPAVRRMVHPGACALARAGICAESQGKLEPMADALFRNQHDGRPVEALAREVGLDLPIFSGCLSAPETERRLASDIAAGMAIGLRATPTWVVNGKLHVGEIPIASLPPPRAASR
jgi:protein-disulfide isomerase